MKKKENVAFVKCTNYEQKKVDNAVRKAINLLGFKFKKGMKVLIKPNVVGSFPKTQLATTTNPALVEAVCKILKKYNCKIFIGDSPFMDPEGSFKASGIDKVAKKYGELAIFEQMKLFKIRDRKAKFLKDFNMAKIIRDADLIINMPKLKTHMLTKYTGAIKNLYGCIPGGLKQKLHLRAKKDKDFSNLLSDIYQNVKPELTIMDAVVGMEGNGPSAGKAIKVGLILASKNGVALDIAASKMIGIKPETMLTIKEAVKRKLYSGWKFNVVGIGKLPKFKFRLPTSKAKSGAKKLVSNLFKEKPIVVNEKKCIKCGLCASRCPAKAITLKPYPIIDKKKCIRCYCCIEICPQHVLYLKEKKIKKH